MEEETATLIDKVREHPVYDTLCDALACFGYEWKDVEPAAVEPATVEPATVEPATDSTE